MIAYLQETEYMLKNLFINCLYYLRCFFVVIVIEHTYNNKYITFVNRYMENFYVKV